MREGLGKWTPRTRLRLLRVRLAAEAVATCFAPCLWAQTLCRQRRWRHRHSRPLHLRPLHSRPRQQFATSVEVRTAFPISQQPPQLVLSAATLADCSPVAPSPLPLEVAGRPLAAPCSHPSGATCCRSEEAALPLDLPPERPPHLHSRRRPRQRRHPHPCQPVAPLCALLSVWPLKRHFGRSRLHSESSHCLWASAVRPSAA